MSIEPQFFDARDGVRLAWREMGEGRPILLLHGLFSSAEVNWIKFGTAARIARAGYHVIMPDLRVHGSSAAPHGAEHRVPGRPCVGRARRQLVRAMDLSRCEELAARAAAGDPHARQALIEALWPEWVSMISSSRRMASFGRSDDHARNVATRLLEKFQKGDGHVLVQYRLWRERHAGKTFGDWMSIVVANARFPSGVVATSVIARARNGVSPYCCRGWLNACWFS